LELNAGERGFLRAYYTNEDAGDSYDAVFTAFRMQEYAKDDNNWFRDYTNRWISSGNSSLVYNSPGFPQPVFDPGPPPTFVFDYEAIENWYSGQ
jgi:iron complex outermembrane receptor protein